MVSISRPPITQRAAMQRLISVVFEDKTTLLITPDEQAAWIWALMQMAAFVAKVPAERRRERILEAATKLLPDLQLREA